MARDRDRFGDLCRESRSLSHGVWRAAKIVRQPSPLDQLHREPGPPVGLSDAIDSHDVWVVDGGDRLGLAGVAVSGGGTTGRADYDITRAAAGRTGPAARGRSAWEAGRSPRRRGTAGRPPSFVPYSSLSASPSATANHRFVPGHCPPVHAQQVGTETRFMRSAMSTSNVAPCGRCWTLRFSNSFKHRKEPAVIRSIP